MIFEPSQPAVHSVLLVRVAVVLLVSILGRVFLALLIIGQVERKLTKIYLFCFPISNLLVKSRLSEKKLNLKPARNKCDAFFSIKMNV